MYVHKFRKRPERSQLFLTLTLILCIISSILLLTQASLHAAQVTLAWDANAEPVAGYRLHYGHASGAYPNSVDAGKGTTYTWPNLADGKTYYFAATAYDESNNQSDYSEELVCHTIVPTAGTGGSISPAATVFVKSGGSQTFQIAAQPGYQIANVMVGNVSMGPQASHTFSAVEAPQTITASFVPVVPTYTITASVSGSGGSITPQGTTQVSHGGSQTYTISAQESRPRGRRR
ncbi:MAG: fibronectin type III domain-containing protein [Syntrophobacteraceae bacterium]|nr:fibronectin type III domain-containing protein [Syntrophobacteraceae bacterium]